MFFGKKGKISDVLRDDVYPYINDAANSRFLTIDKNALHRVLNSLDFAVEHERAQYKPMVRDDKELNRILKKIQKLPDSEFHQENLQQSLEQLDCILKAPECIRAQRQSFKSALPIANTIASKMPDRDRLAFIQSSLVASPVKSTSLDHNNLSGLITAGIACQESDHVEVDRETLAKLSDREIGRLSDTYSPTNIYCAALRHASDTVQLEHLTDLLDSPASKSSIGMVCYSFKDLLDKDTINEALKEQLIEATKEYLSINQSVVKDAVQDDIKTDNQGIELYSARNLVQFAFSNCTHDNALDFLREFPDAINSKLSTGAGITVPLLLNNPDVGNAILNEVLPQVQDSGGFFESVFTNSVHSGNWTDRIKPEQHEHLISALESAVADINALPDYSQQQLSNALQGRIEIMSEEHAQELVGRLAEIDNPHINDAVRLSMTREKMSDESVEALDKLYQTHFKP